MIGEADAQETNPSSPTTLTPSGLEGAPSRTPSTTPEGLQPLQSERAEPVVVAPPPPSPPTPPLEEPLDPDSYVCGRGDVFELNFWGAQNLKWRVTVDVEGRAFIAKVGYIDVRGKTLTKARALITRAMQRYYPGLSFDLSLAQPRTFLVHVVESVAKPGIVDATPLDRVSLVVKKAGGIEKGSLRRIEVIHRDKTSTSADLLMYTLTGDTSFNPRVVDGDVVRVPTEGLMVSVSGPVFRPGRYELVKTTDLQELVDLAGGLQPVVTRQLPIRVIRRDERERATVTDVPFPDKGALPAFALRADDKVEIPSSDELQPGLLLVGALAGQTTTAGASPNAVDETTVVKRLPLYGKDTVRTTIERGGGLSPSADLSHSFIRRKDKVVPLDLEALLVRRDFSADKPVAYGDVIVVPYQKHSITMQGAVARPGVYPYNPEYKVEEYIAIAGGITHQGQDMDSVRLLSPSGQSTAYSPRMAVEAGDTIVVPERGFTRAETAQLILSGVSLLLSSVLVVYSVTR